MNHLGPVRVAERLDALDVLRGVALCGILLMNIPEMGSSWFGWFPAGTASLADPSWIVWVWMKLLFEGSMRGLFTLLFGAGILFMTRRAATPDGPVAVADVYYRRCIGLVALGIVNAIVLLWPGDILFMYGIAGLFLFVARRASPRRLFVLAGATILATMLSVGLLRVHGDGVLYRAERVDAVLAAPGHPPLTATQQAALKARVDLLKKIGATPEELAQERVDRGGAYPALVYWAASTWVDFVMSPFGIFGGILESVGFMLLGMALFKSGVLTGERPRRFYLGLAAASLAVALPLRGLSAWLTWSGYSLHPTFASALYQNLSYEAMRLPLTLAWMGLLLAAWKTWRGGAWRPLRALGRMALTNYLGQSLLTSVLFYGFHLYGRLNWAQLWGIAVLVWIAQALFSMAWLRRFAMGPAEWWLRSITYGERPPWRVEAGAAEAG